MTKPDQLEKGFTNRGEEIFKKCCKNNHIFGYDHVSKRDYNFPIPRTKKMKSGKKIEN